MNVCDMFDFKSKSFYGEDYVILTLAENTDENMAGYLGYQTKMLKRNPQPFTLSFEMGAVDQRIEIYYKCTGMKPLVEIISEGKFTDDMFIKLIKCIMDAFSICKTLLLNEIGFILDEKLIYLDGFDFKLIYAPFDITGSGLESLQLFVNNIFINLGFEREVTRKIVEHINAGRTTISKLTAMLNSTLDSYSRDDNDDYGNDYNNNDNNGNDKSDDDSINKDIPEDNYIDEGHILYDEYSDADAFIKILKNKWYLAFGGIIIILSAAVWLWNKLHSGLLRFVICAGVILFGNFLLSELLDINEEENSKSDSSGKMNDFEQKDDYLHSDLLIIPPGAASESFMETEMSLQSGDKISDTGNYDEDTDETVLLFNGPRIRTWLEIGSNESGDLCRYAITGDVFKIGRNSEHSDLILSDKTVGRRHAEIKNINGRYHIMDLNSKNGTLLNDSLVEAGVERELKNGDSLCFAGNIFIFKTNSDQNSD